MRTPSIFVALSLLVFGVGSGGCTPRMAANLATGAIVGAAIVGTAMLLSHHDDHIHSARCGHPRRRHHGHWVYYYKGRWEYRDDGRWYVYRR